MVRVARVCRILARINFVTARSSTVTLHANAAESGHPVIACSIRLAGVGATVVKVHRTVVSTVAFFTAAGIVVYQVNTSTPAVLTGRRPALVDVFCAQAARPTITAFAEKLVYSFDA